MVAPRNGTKSSSDRRSLKERAASIKDVVQRINEPQSLDVNLHHLKEMGGVGTLENGSGSWCRCYHR
jgi:hypothetical protein